MTAIVLRGSALALPLPDESVDLVVTSPPYFALRSYTDAGEHYAGQIGSEATPAEFLEELWAATAEMVRVLKPSGSIFVNLGDKYGSVASGQNLKDAAGKNGRGPKRYDGGRGRRADGMRDKSLIGLPWRYAIGCMDRLDLILRAEIIWDKPNGLPESVTDRVRRSHEQWFHFTKEPRYFSAVNEIREPHVRIDPPRMLGTRNRTQRHEAATDNTGWKSHMVAHNPLGKLPGSVWSVASEPLIVPDRLDVDHFAAFPTAWPKRLISGWSPSGICLECGEGRRPKVERPGLLGGDNNPASRDGTRVRSTLDGGSREWAARMARPDFISGHTCSCPTSAAPTRPAVVLDPLGGTGTTALVASCLGRIGVAIDLSHDYCRLARWRTSDTGQRAKVLGIEKPPVETPGQGSMFAELEVEAS